MSFIIEFYETEDGKEPVKEFLDSLDDKMAAKLIGLMEVLEEKGTELRKPYSEHLDDGIEDTEDTAQRDKTCKRAACGLA